jgi:hypothetical protein
LPFVQRLFRSRQSTRSRSQSAADGKRLQSRVSCIQSDHIVSIWSILLLPFFFSFSPQEKCNRGKYRTKSKADPWTIWSPWSVQSISVNNSYGCKSLNPCICMFGTLLRAAFIRNTLGNSFFSFRVGLMWIWSRFGRSLIVWLVLKGFGFGPFC